MAGFNKKVFIVSFFFPPLGGGGVQRMLKFAKYLPDFGWQPVVLTVKNWQYYAFDSSELKYIHYPVYRVAPLNWQIIYEWLYKFRLDFVAHFLKKKETIYLFPDRMIGWLPCAYFYAKKIIKQHKPDLIYTTSPPNTSHLLGYLLKLNTNLPWIADFRDEWSDYKFVSLPPCLKSFHKTFEKRVLHKADAVTTVTPWVTRLLRDKCTRTKGKFHTIYNGFDQDDIKTDFENNSKNGKFHLLHMGTLYGNRNADYLLKAVKHLTEKNQIPAREIKLEFVGSPGSSDSSYKDVVINRNLYLNHSECLKVLNAADVAVLIQSNEGRTGIPAKTFEYLAMQKPILALIPNNSMLTEILSQLQVKTICPFDDINAIADAILFLYRNWKNKQLQISYDKSILHKYERKLLTRQLSDIFNNTVAQI